ncbi:hypothetical protein DUHN55_31170 [Helicobacter pylori]
MGLDFAFRHLITQVGWAAPLAITALVIGGWALLRRDEGMWWKLVVGGVAALLGAGAVSGRRGTQGTSR